MNERIQALAEQAGQESFDSEHTALLQVSTEHTMYEVPAGFIVKFAELIVRECGKVAFDDWCEGTNESSSEIAILKHFNVGVES